MKALFLVDNIPAVEMFAPIIQYIGGECECVFINFDGWTEYNRERIASYAQSLGVRCELLKQHSKREVRSVLVQEKPSILVFSREETTVAQALFVELANAMNIPTLLVPHGMISDDTEEEMWRLNSRFARIFSLYRLARQGFARMKMGKKYFPRLLRIGLYRIRNDFRNSVSLSRWDRYSMVAAYGETMRDILVKYGVASDSIVITGNPKFDAVYDKRNITYRKMVLLITDYMVEFGLWSTKQRREFVLSVCRAMESLPEYELVIKIHPVMESLKDYRLIVQNMPNPPTICQHEAIAELIKDCDLAITVVSSAGLEVMAVGKPLVMYDPFDGVVNYRETDGAYVAHTENDLVKVLGQLVSNGMEEQHKKLAMDFLYRQAYLQDGKSTVRIGDLIKKMMKEGQPCNVAKNA